MVDVPSRAEFDALNARVVDLNRDHLALIERVNGLGNVYSPIDHGHGAPPPPVEPPPVEPPPPATGSRDATVWPFTSTSPWNMPIGSGAQYGSDAGLPGAGSINASWYSHPVYIAKSSDPLRRIWRYAGNGDPNIPNGTVIELGPIRCPVGVEAANGSDRHLHIINPAHTHVFEMFGARTEQPDGSIKVTAQYTGDLSEDGIGDFRGAWQGTRAYGGSALGGLIREWDIEQGRIPHALAAAIGGDYLKSPYVWPATIQDNNWRTTYSGQIPMGAMFAIPTGTTAPSGLTEQGVMLFNALREYGMFITDQGGPHTTLYAEPKLDSRIDGIRRDWPTIRPFLRRVTNIAEDNVGGGGVPRVPLAPELS